MPMGCFVTLRTASRIKIRGKFQLKAINPGLISRRTGILSVRCFVLITRFCKPTSRKNDEAVGYLYPLVMLVQPAPSECCHKYKQMFTSNVCSVNHRKCESASGGRLPTALSSNTEKTVSLMRQTPLRNLVVFQFFHVYVESIK